MGETGPQRPVFYFDLGSPFAWLAAERVHEILPSPPLWQPVLLGALFKRFGRDSWARTAERATGIAEVERRAAERDLPPLRWPDPFPTNTLLAMRAATFAAQTGRAAAFSLAAFRQAFCAGRDLADPEWVLMAGAAAELHPRALQAAVARQQVKDELRRATGEAGDLGVRGVPTVRVGDDLFWGDDQLEQAAAAVR